MKPSEFSKFFRAITGHTAYRWQQKLAERVCRDGFPTLINYPAGSGRSTAILLAWLFGLALRSDTVGKPIPRRLALVTNRRTAVDVLAEYATNTMQFLQQTDTGIVGEVAQRLRSLSRADVPFRVVSMRGGRHDDYDVLYNWMRDPAQPTVITTTVDQLGSRLLFRGYGLKESIYPMTAGLLGTDTLIVLQETRGSAAFADTLRQLARYRGWAEKPMPSPFEVVEVRALPLQRESGETAFSYDAKGDEDLGALAQARKPSQLKVTAQSASDLIGTLVDEAKRVEKLMLSGSVIGVVCNTVDRAREVYDKLRRHAGNPAKTNVYVELQTGRMRPIDRIRQLRQREIENETAVLRFVVSTQSIEMGTEFLFDGMVTEAAPLDALQQRFARLRCDEQRKEACHASVVALHKQVNKETDDRIYGASLRNTWKWLDQRTRLSKKDGTVDMSVAAVYEDLPEDVTPLLSPVLPAPVLLPAMLDLWAQTSPVPNTDPMPSLWLHGYDPGKKPREPDCTVVWRADLDANKPETWVEQVELCPPLPAEMMRVPAYAVRQWLSEAKLTEFGDIEGQDSEDEKAEKGKKQSKYRATPKQALLWLGEDDESRLTEYPRGGDVIVVPSEYGGVDEYGWDPERVDPLPDVYEEASLVAETPMLRLIVGQLGNPDLEAAVRNYCTGLSKDEKPKADAMLDAALPHLSGYAEQCASKLRKMGARIEEYGKRAWVISPRVKRFRGRSSGCPAGPVTLEDHSEHVATWAKAFSKSCHVPKDVAQDMVLAAEYHDEGKKEPREQAYMYGDTPNGKVLAKSGPRTRKADRQALRCSGWPKHARHEVVSMTLLQHAPDEWRERAHDPDLVLYLVSTHHGYCRPFAPLVIDPAAKNGTHATRADAGVAERFWLLVRRYGWYGLAYLEALTRLADWGASREEDGK